MMTIRNILFTKPSDIWSISPRASAYEALELMAKKDIGALPVIEGGQLLGIFSERDYARKVILKGRSSRDTSVGELMSTPVVSVGPDAGVYECMALMTEKKHRHLPVVEDGKFAGFISIGDVVNAVIKDQKITIRDLEVFICGGEQPCQL